MDGREKSRLTRWRREFRESQVIQDSVIKDEYYLNYDETGVRELCLLNEI